MTSGNTCQPQSVSCVRNTRKLGIIFTVEDAFLLFCSLQASRNVIFQGDYAPLARKALSNQLQNAQKRKEQFLHRIERCEKLARSCGRDDLVDKHEREVLQVI